ncbi:MAG: glycosyltransferase family 4 protein [Bacteroidales bacterium]|nr:glycosyltransferase family 4 protein [Bacteroidales bacterium]
MRIWIVNYYTSPNCSNPRYLQFARHFMARGWDVTTFYANWKEADTEPLFKQETVDGLDFVRVKAPHYVGNGVSRMKSIFSFACAIKKHCKEFEQPDVILHNVHTPFDYPVVWAAKKLGAKYIAEAWDAWPDVFAHLGLVSRKNPALKVFYQIEKRLYEKADAVVFTILGMMNHIQEKRWTTNMGGKIALEKVHYINSGVDLEQFDKDRQAYPRLDEDINDPKFLKVVYLGSINRANHVHTLIEAAKLLQNLPMYRFFIYGDGADREELERKVKAEGITNVVFKEKHIPLCEVAWVVSQANVNIMNYQKGFGYMGVSSGKMFQYLAAGKPIVCNVNIAYDDVITDNQLGIARDIETPEDFAQAIRDVAEQPRASYDAMCERVRKTAERFDYKKLCEEEAKVIEGVV